MKKRMINAPIPGKQYALTGKTGDTCIANGDSWQASEIKTLKRDGVEVMKGTENEIFEWIINHTSFSNDWAFKYEGYTIE